MSKHPPSTPARLGVVVPGAVRPRGAPSPPRQRAATQERVQFPAYSHLSGRRGAAERQRGTTPGGGVVVRGGGRHAEAARPRSRESWHSLLRSLSRGIRGLPRLPHSLKDGFGPRGPTACGPGPESASCLWLRLAGPTARALCWPCL